MVLQRATINSGVDSTDTITVAFGWNIPSSFPCAHANRTGCPHPSSGRAVASATVTERHDNLIRILSLVIGIVPIRIIILIIINIMRLATR